MSYRELEAAPMVVRSDFPADVTTPDGRTLQRARIIVTAFYAYVWTDQGEPAVAAPLAGAAPDVLHLRGTFAPPGVPNVVETTLGELSWIRGRGCSCGALAHFRPFAGPNRSGRITP